MKKLIATKVFDKNCEICQHMSRHDRATFEGLDGVNYQEVHLDDILDNRGDLTKVRIYQLLERHCLSPTYEIDLPVYLLMTPKGQYVDHFQGAKTIREIRDWYSDVNVPTE